MERFYNTVTGIQSSLSEREANDALNSFVSKAKSVKFLSIFIYHTSLNQCNANEILIFKACRGTQQHEEIQLGLLYGILTDPKMAPKV